ncbi:Zinc/iron permease [Mortierella sp. GBAus27b]|nr:hypothetical protein BGX31_005916 [Mortierella sp. GBA43]KAI8356897.1 Zinc/iron permease [Mortierella sp. GBAus27b]
MEYNGTEDYRAWAFTLASAMACVFGAALIFIDTVASKFLGRDVRILHNHKFLAGSLGLGSGVMIFSSFYNILPEAKEKLSSDLSIFNAHVDAALITFFFVGVGCMGLIHWIIHRFNTGTRSPGIESSDAIEQFIQRETGQQSILSQHAKSQNQPLGHAPNRVSPGTGPISTAPTTHGCKGCEPDSSDHDSEYVDDEVTSLLNNAFLQIGKTPNSCMDDGEHMQRHVNTRKGAHDHDDDDDDDDAGSIEVVITDQKDKILGRPADHTGNKVDVDLELNQDDYADRRKSSWSSASTRSPKPFAPVNRKKRTSVSQKGSRHSTDCPSAHAGTQPSHASKLTSDLHSSHHHDHHPHHSTGVNTLPTYGAIPSTANRHHTRPSPSPPTFPRPDLATLRRTSFPRLKGSGTIYSNHDVLDHAVADDREHADLTEIGIQTALAIAIHKFPEGLITFLSTTTDPCLGLSVFMAISVHNIIEGYLIAFPLFIGLHSRSKAFVLAAALGGLSQPLGALLGWFILRKVASLGWQVSATGCIYAMVAGMMSSIAVNGMWPQAVKCVGRNPTKVVQYCFFAGIGIMGICQAVMGAKCNF